MLLKSIKKLAKKKAKANPDNTGNRNVIGGVGYGFYHMLTNHENGSGSGSAGESGGGGDGGGGGGGE